MNRLFNAAAGYTVAGLVAGVFYREFTKAQSFTGTTQLSLMHTHLLSLGTLVFLIVLALEKVLALTESRWFPLFFVAYQFGLILTVFMLLVHGTLTVLGHSSGVAVAGLAGLGHIGLAAGLYLFFATLRDRITTTATTP